MEGAHDIAPLPHPMGVVRAVVARVLFVIIPLRVVVGSMM